MFNYGMYYCLLVINDVVCNACAYIDFLTVYDFDEFWEPFVTVYDGWGLILKNRYFISVDDRNRYVLLGSFFLWCSW